MRASLVFAGWSSLVARQAHNLKVLGSNPSPAPRCRFSKPRDCRQAILVFLFLVEAEDLTFFLMLFYKHNKERCVYGYIS